MATKRKPKTRRASGRAAKNKAASRKLARADGFIGRLKGQFQVVGDITQPLDPPEVWTGDLDNLGSDPEPQS
jgi:hypothetical protein